MSEAASSRRGVSVILPARNEETALPAVLRSVREAVTRLPAGLGCEILVVDDGSTDATAQVAAADAAVRVLSLPAGRGYGAALKRGIRASSFDTIVILDADGSYPADAIPALVTMVEAGAEQAITVRSMERRPISFWRRAVKHAITRFAEALTRQRVPDLNTGMRAFRKPLVEPLLRSMPDTFSFSTTLTVASLLDGWDVRWHPVSYRQRAGRSKFRPVRDTALLLLSLLRAVVYFEPLKLFLPVAVGLGIGAAVFFVWDAVWERNLTDKTVLLSLSSLEVFVLGLLADLVVRKLR